MLNRKRKHSQKTFTLIFCNILAHILAVPENCRNFVANILNLWNVFQNF